MKVKKWLAFFLVFLLAVTANTVPALPVGSAESSVVTDVTYFEDGSYLVTRIIYGPSAKASNTISSFKVVEHHGIFGDLLWEARVNGTFTYNGTTATCTSAAYDYATSDASWRFKDGSAYCSGNQAIADVSFTGPLFASKSVTITLTCSPDGTLS